MVKIGHFIRWTRTTIMSLCPMVLLGHSAGESNRSIPKLILDDDRMLKAKSLIWLMVSACLVKRTVAIIVEITHLPSCNLWIQLDVVIYQATLLGAPKRQTTMSSRWRNHLGTMLKCNSTRKPQSCFRTMSSPFLLVKYTDLWVIWVIEEPQAVKPINKEDMFTIIN